MTVFWVSSAANVTRPEAATKSTGDSASLESVVHSTVTALPIGRDNVMGTATAVVPEFPSTTEAPPGCRVGGVQPGVPGTHSATRADGVFAAKSPGLEPPLVRVPMPAPTSSVPSRTAAPDATPETVPGARPCGRRRSAPVVGVVHAEVRSDHAPDDHDAGHRARGPVAGVAGQRPSRRCSARRSRRCRGRGRARSAVAG